MHRCVSAQPTCVMLTLAVGWLAGGVRGVFGWADRTHEGMEVRNPLRALLKYAAAPPSAYSISSR
jgi:hypothetical protein